MSDLERGTNRNRRREASKRSRMDKTIKKEIRFLQKETVRTFKESKRYIDAKSKKLQFEIEKLRTMLGRQAKR